MKQVQCRRQVCISFQKPNHQQMRRMLPTILDRRAGVHRETGDAGEPCAFPMGRCRQLPGRSSSRRLWRDVPVIPSAADRQTSAAKVFSPPPSVRSGGLGIHLEFMVPPPPDWNWLSATLFPAAKRWRNACPERAWSRLSTPTVTRISPTPVTRMAEG